MGIPRKLSGFFGVVDYRNFCYGGVFYGIDNLFNPKGNGVTIRDFPALATNSGRNILNNDNTTAHISGEGGETFPQGAFTHKTIHFISLRLILKSSDHSAGSGK
jgi:hypothetical protein